MLSKEISQQIAQDWIKAWNAHNLDQVLTHYAEDIILVSPIAARLLDNPSGLVTGKTALRAYFQRGLDAYPSLHFNLIDVMWGINSLVLHYINQEQVKVAELVEVNQQGKIIRAIVHYSQ